MNHIEIQERIHLFLTNELGEKDSALITEHLSACSECRRVKEETSTLIAAARQAAGVNIDEQLLTEARFQLRSALRRERNKATVAERVMESLRLFIQPRLSFAAGAAAILIAAVVTGYYVGKNSSVDLPGQELTANVQSGDSLNVRTGNISIVNYNPRTNELEVAYDVVTRARVKTRLQDDDATAMIVKSLFENSNSESRLRSIDLLRDVSSSKRKGSKEAVEALIKAARLDESPAVRREAIVALGSFAFDKRILQTALETLRSDENPGVRIAAINLVAIQHTPTGQEDQSLVNALRQTMKNDNNSYVRLKSKMLLQEVTQL